MNGRVWLTLLIVFGLIIRNISADEGWNSRCVNTKAIDGFCIGVIGSSLTATNTPIDDKLSFCIWRTTATNDDVVYIPTEREYIYRIRLLDTNGDELPKTELGRSVGVKFSELEPAFDPAYKLTIMKAMDDGEWGGRYLFFPFRPGFGGQAFYSPKDLFVVSTPGRFRLEICFQIILRSGSGTNEACRVVRFPPIDYPLIKL